MLGCQHNLPEVMTYSHKKQNSAEVSDSKLTQSEWNEMVALKKAINYDITQVHPEKMEQFTEYLVRSLKERGG